MNLLFAVIGAFAGGVLAQVPAAFALAVAGALAGWWWSAHGTSPGDEPGRVLDGIPPAPLRERVTLPVQWRCAGAALVGVVLTTIGVAGWWLFVALGHQRMRAARAGGGGRRLGLALAGRRLRGADPAAPRRHRLAPARRDRMKTAALAALGLACTQAAPAASSDAVLPLTLGGTGPYYTLDLTLPARQLSASPGLADLRVRNAAGETMAFAWVDASTPPPLQRVPARLYKVPLPPAPASAAAGAPRQAWIVDTLASGDDLLHLDLGLEDDTQGVYTLSIEASDDLQHWRTLQLDAQLVQLEALPQVGAAAALAPQARRERLGSNGIDLDEVRTRYLRLTTAARSGIPPLVSATITRAPHRPAPPPLQWSDPIAASHCEATSCDYPLPRNAALAAVQVAPSDVDTIAQVMVMGQVDADRLPPPRRWLLHGPLHALRLKAERAPAQAGMAWDSAAMANVYWLTQPSGAPDLHSPPVRLDGAPWRMLRLETFGPITQLGHAAPTIRIGIRPRQLVFVARGAGPFVLARAPANDRTAPMPLAQLMPGRAPDAPLPQAAATLAAAAPAASATPLAAGTATSAPAPVASRTPWLWAALLAGLALMGGVAWSLLRKPRGPPPGLRRSPGAQGGRSRPILRASPRDGGED